MRPAVTGVSPATRASRVDLPAPFGPSTPSTSPGAAVRLTAQGEAAAADLGVDDEAVAGSGAS